MRTIRKRRAVLTSRQLWKLCFRRALRKRCPQCGRGHLFRRRFRLHERCGNCGLVYRRARGSELGSMGLISEVTQVFAVLLILGIGLGTDWGALPSLLVSVPLTVGFAYLCLPWSQAAWVAFDYVTDAQSGEWWANPRP